jgi:lipopolysaccharide export LptBFGC system permease protein LptF
MSRTLFWYIFKDLFRIFMLASGALSAIMSFGGLLRPLYEYGLDVGQVAQILSYSSPAMTAYSLPIAALFATTIVFGRLGADNEITACRAAGISHLSMALPALVLGLMTAFASLGLLCFVVPASTLKVERIIYSNLAKLVASQIERTHQIRFEHENQPITVFAQEAIVLPTDRSRPNDQAVQLIGPMIVTYEQVEKNRPPVPHEFNTATEATAFIHQNVEDDEVTMWASLTNGTRFPRNYMNRTRQESMQVSVRATQFGPMPLPSPVKENTKFMDIFKLRSMLDQPEKSRRIKTLLDDFVQRDQEQQYLQQLSQSLNGPAGSVELNGNGETYVLTRGTAPAELRKDRLVMEGDPTAGKAARLLQTRGAQSVLDVNARTVRIKAFPDAESKKIQIEIEMLDCVVTVAGIESPHENFTRPLTVPMPDPIYALTTRPAKAYIAGSLSVADKQRLRRDLLKLTNSVISELHARVSFAVSCLILVMVGCALGMMFRSGNFLSAFAVSVVPALISIALVVTGQHTCENVPWDISSPNWVNPLNLGLMLIWSGNAAVLVIAVVLLGRLQRQ